MPEVPSFGAWLKRRRKALDLTQANLARLVGCSEVSIRKIEADEQRPSRQTAERLAQQLQIPLEQQATFVQFARLGLDEVPPALPIPATAQLPEAPPPTQRAVSGAAQPASGTPTARPSGMVTFLFTDIEDSTHLWEHTPEAMRRAKARHDQIVYDAIAAAGGYAYKIIGDAFHAAFATATQALSAALAAQRALHAEAWDTPRPLRVRMALHTGVTEERDADYVGPLLNRVARLMAAGSGGQTLLTLATAELVRDQLADGVSLRDLREHHLKDLIRPEHVFQLIAPGLPTEFPPLRTVKTRTNNLPAQLTSFVGREKESAEIKQLLANHRLTTLTGSGGTGKTRLALHVAAEVLETFQSGVWLVELAPLSDAALVPQAVAGALGLREDASRDMLATLMDFLNARSLLLILDNCEHVLEVCAQVAETLLRACPNLRILASSREALGIAGEASFRVPSLRTPDIRRLPPLDTLSQYEAVQLFVERAAAVLPGFRLTQDNAPDLAQICSRLDGIPLALELAAVRVNVLRVGQIAVRLDDRFRLLTGGSRTAVPRQQTLRALIDWM